MISYRWYELFAYFRCLQLCLNGLIKDLYLTFIVSLCEDGCSYLYMINSTPPLHSRLYRVLYPKAEGLVEFPAEGFRGRANFFTNLWIHFVHRHVQYMVVILEEGKLLHPCFPYFDIFVPWDAIGSHHPNTAFFTRERNWSYRWWRRKNP